MLQWLASHRSNEQKVVIRRVTSAATQVARFELGLKLGLGSGLGFKVGFV